MRIENRLWSGLSLLAAATMLLMSGLSLADDFALVVGVDTYKYGTNKPFPRADEIRNLKGAGNDAMRIATALRAVGVALPDSRVLLNDAATLSAFKDAWQQVIDQSLPGDNIIVTFAGHGGQEKERFDPIDEASGDGHDETLMFWDFDPRAPHTGRLLDDELFQMFKRASDRQILFVADSCHSAGLTRTLAGGRAGLSRAGGVWDLGASGDLSDIVTIDAEEGEDWEALSHVTYLTGTDNEALVINEVLVDGVAHGALSVSFAEGMEGLADTNNDNVVRRDELANYISVRVSAIANQMQTPGFSPRGASTDDMPIFSLPADGNSSPTTTVAATDTPLAVSVSGLSLPAQIRHAAVNDSANLYIEKQSSNTVAYYGADEVTRWPNSSSDRQQLEYIQLLVDKFRLLETIDASYNNRQVPAIVSVADCRLRREREHCNYRHSIGDAIKINIGQLETDNLSTANGRYFVFFNLAGAGNIQLLYPTHKEDLPQLNELPLEVGLDVAEPVGRDDLVAVFCKNDPIKLKTVLKDYHERNAPTPAVFLRSLSDHDCQMNRLSVFTGV